MHLGEFDSGGLKNNLRINFTTWHTQVLGLMKYDVIRVISPLIARYGFSFFRILNFKQQSNLLVNVTAQAYPHDYYLAMEGMVAPSPILPNLVFPVAEPKRPVFSDYNYSGGFLNVTVTNP